MGITEHLVTYITKSIAAGGYPVIGFLMMLESMVFPVPSEAVMPFAGFLVTDGTFSFWTVVLVSTMGSLIGSLLSYAIGRYGGRIFLEKWGKYFLLNQHHLDATETFFKGHGGSTIFVARFIPVVRHLISIPAGIAKMNLATFPLYTLLGAGLWNMFLLYIGMMLGQNWSTLGPYMHYLDILVVGALVLGAGWLVLKRR